MKAIIDIDLVKSIVDNNHIREVIFDSITLDELVIDTERIWWPCYKGHTWSDTSYTWADDFSTCTASRHCTIDNCTHSETLEGKVVSTTTPPTCTAKGVRHHTAIFEVSQDSDWVLTDQFTTESIPETGHSWNDPTYEWADDYSTCTATRICSNDSSHIDPVTCATISSTTNPTCTVDGYTTYLAEFSDTDWADIQTQKETIPATGHAYEGVLEKPTCTTDGCTTYTCKNCGDSYKITENALGHDYGAWTIDLEPTCIQEGIKKRYCRRVMCDAYETEAIPALGHTEVIDAAVVPTCTETGLTEGKHCSVCNEVLVAQKEVPALGHKAGELITVKEPTLTETGLMQRECTVCHEVIYYKIIDKLGPVTYELSTNEAYYIASAYSTDIEGEIEIVANYRGLPVTHIKQDAFRDCLNITKVVIPDSIITIGHSAFNGCSSLVSVDIGNNVTSIQGYAFNGCSSITRVVIPNSVTTIGNHAFSNCDSLASVVIGDSVTSIGSWAFSYCYNLDSMMIGDSVTSIGSYAFYQCRKLTSIEIPDSVTTIGNHAFSDCDSLDSVYINDLSNWCNITFDGNLSNPLNQIGELYLNGELVTELVIPDGITKINNYAFCHCSSLTSVVIPDSVTSIGDYAFLSCNLNDVCFGENSQLTSIGKQAFLYCMFTGITIPSSVTHIGAKAFGRLFSSSFEVTLLNNTACWELSNPDDESAEHINVNNYTATQLGKMFVGNKHEYEWNAREHAYGEWSVTKEPTCSSPGTKRSECSRCGYHQTLDIPATGVHDYKLSVTLPTCTKMGYTTYMCTHCSHSYVDMDSYVEAKGHSPSDWIIDIEPTLAAEGSKHKECNHCGEILETGTIPKLDNSTYLVTESGEFLTDEQGNLLIL